MNNIETLKLSNGLKVILKNNPNTPRLSLNIFINSGIQYESKAGVASLAGRMLLQGTKTRTAEQIAQEIDNNALDINIDSKQDYTKVKSTFLNEDLGVVVDILSDILKNSTFENFEKEKAKFKGEIGVDLDSTRVKAVDNLVKNMYSNHPYGNTHTKILEVLEDVNADIAMEYYQSTLSANNMNIVVVGDFDKANLLDLLEKGFGDIESKDVKPLNLNKVELSEDKTVTIEKHDAAQAQVLQGWVVPSILHEDYAALSVLNTILGSCGLSSRLFVELRDKQGLAYVVRSSYEPLKHSGNFTVYIATEPKNIQVSLDGFKNEIKKLQNEPVDEKELKSAIQNIIGKRAFFHETNTQQAHYLGYYDIIGLGIEYDEKINEKIKNITAQDVQKAAQKYLSTKSIVSLLAPKESLK